MVGVTKKLLSSGPIALQGAICRLKISEQGNGMAHTLGNARKKIQKKVVVRSRRCLRYMGGKRTGKKKIGLLDNQKEKSNKSPTQTKPQNRKRTLINMGGDPSQSLRRLAKGYSKAVGSSISRLRRGRRDKVVSESPRLLKRKKKKVDPDS